MFGKATKNETYRFQIATDIFVSFSRKVKGAEFARTGMPNNLCRQWHINGQPKEHVNCLLMAMIDTNSGSSKLVPDEWTSIMATL